MNKTLHEEMPDLLDVILYVTLGWSFLKDWLWIYANQKKSLEEYSSFQVQYIGIKKDIYKISGGDHVFFLEAYF